VKARRAYAPRARSVADLTLPTLRRRARAALVAYRAARAAWLPARRAPWGPKDPFSVAVAAREEWHRWQAMVDSFDPSV
jgi:hypothetical protein